MAFLSLQLYAANEANGKAAYEKSCKGCHGADGSGNPGMAKMLKVEMRPLSSKEVQAHSDAEIKGIIQKGQGKMPAQAGVNDATAADLTAFLRSLKK